MRWEEEVLVKLKCFGFFENFCSVNVPIQNQLRDGCRQRKHLEVTRG